MSGGWVMLPLALLACLLYSSAFTLLIYVLKTSLSGKEQFKWRDWVKNPDQGEGRVGAIIRYTQDNIKTEKQVRHRFEEIRLSLVNMIEGRLKLLFTLVSIAPLMGLLGTVLGMLATFQAMAVSSGEEAIGAIAEGISEALVTTQTGLTIALPGLFLVMVIKRHKHSLEAKLARLESLTLTHLQKNNSI